MLFYNEKAESELDELAFAVYRTKQECEEQERVLKSSLVQFISSPKGLLTVMASGAAYQCTTNDKGLEEWGRNLIVRALNYYV